MPAPSDGYIPTVRAAKREDAEDAAALLRESILELCVADHHNDETTLRYWLSNKTREHLEQWIAEPTNFLPLVYREELLVGLGLLHRSGDLQLCYVKPGQTGKGAGRAVLGAVEVQARRWGLDEIHLTSTHLGRAFYERHGYVPAGPARAGFGTVVGYPYRKRL